MIGNVTAAACAERADLAALLRSLTPEQWQTPTLCGDWTVRDVVAHLLSYEELGVAALLRRFVRGGLRLSGANAVGVAESAHYSPEQLLDLLDRNPRPAGLTTGFGDRIGLLHAMIHQQDIRRALGIRRDIPAERMVPALKFARSTPDRYPVADPWPSADRRRPGLGVGNRARSPRPGRAGADGDGRPSQRYR